MTDSTKKLTTQTIFESIRKTNQDDVEYWYARELMPLLDYGQWRNFHKVIKKAQQTAKETYPHTADHFVEVSKKIKVAIGTTKEATRNITDYKLTRYACYVIAQNGDSRKKPIALAQSYFAQQTRKRELQENQEKNIERILARRKLSETEKKFADILNQRNIEGKEIAEIKSAGDQALFGSPTSQVKAKLGIKQYKPLADHLPTISIKAKDLATEMTTYKTQTTNLHGKQTIKSEHVSNNSAVRKMLTESGIYPEKLPAEEDVKKLEKQIDQKDIRELETEKLLSTNILEIDIRNVHDEGILQEIKAIITNNPGDSVIKIYYSSIKEVKVIERNIEISPEVKNSLKQYLVITNNHTE